MAQKNRTQLLEELLEQRDRLEQCSRVIIGLQGDLASLATERDTLLVEQVNHREELEEVRAIAQEAKQRENAARSDRTAAISERDMVTAENAVLRDRLHGMTIENARLEGYQERVKEYDPVPEKQLHQEQQRPLLVATNAFPPAPSIGVNARDGAGDGRRGRETWFQRRGA